MVKLNLRKWLLNLYFIIVALAFVWLWHINYAPLSIETWRSTFIFAGVAIILDVYYIHLPSGEGLSLTSAFLFASTTTLGINSVFTILLLMGIFNIVKQPQKWAVHIFNGTQYGIAAFGGFLVFSSMGGVVGGKFSFVHPLPYLAFTVVYFVLNVLFVSSFMMIREPLNLFYVVKGFFDKEVLLSYFMIMGFGVVTVLMYESTRLTGILFFSLILGVLASIFRHYFAIYTHFKSLAIRDELTGTYNHREFQTKLSELVQEGRPFALLLLDVDFFKVYNDTLGHPQGDKLLKALSETMGTVISEAEGWLFRYGGEEFAVILPDRDVDDAFSVSEKLCETVASTAFIGTECMPGNHITVSIGISSYPYMTQNRNHVIAYADEALYKAKNLGRNRVEVYKSDLLSLIPALSGETGFDIEGMQELVANLRDVDHYTYRHSERVLHYATSLAERVGVTGKELLYVQCAALLHDVGKCNVPRYILTKPSRMTPEEWELIKAHPVIGEEMVAKLLEIPTCLEMIRHHHERFDGRGYPDALAGEEIPYLARLLTVVGSFDAMTSSRPYQAKRSVQEAVEELRNCSGSQFDPVLAKEFIAIVLDLKVKSLHVGA